MPKKITPKKVTIVSVAALILLLILIFILTVSIRGESASDPEPPKSVSVLFPEKNEILITDYEEFLGGCVLGLLSNVDNPPAEAIRAVAIAEHTRAMYALEHKSASENFGADYMADESFPYNPDRPVPPEIAAAVTELPTLTYDGGLFSPQICKISAGATDADIYSPSNALLCDMSAKGYESSAAFTPEELRRIMGASTVPGDFGSWFHDAEYADTGTLLTIGFCGRTLTGAQLRQALGLRSTAIAVEYREDRFYVSCKGQGENRGMSVNAAVFLAKSGNSAEQILKVFYPDADVS